MDRDSSGTHNDGIEHSSSAWRGDTEDSYRRATERVIETMHERLYESFSLDEMAEVGIMSSYHFVRVFRQLTGIPPAQFFWALRLQEAKRLLLTTQQSVTDICFEVGYNSLGTFTRRFTELVGVPPRRFRSLAEGAGAEMANQLRNYLMEQLEPADDSAVHGFFDVPDDFSGVAFVGLFPKPIPQGSPLACSISQTALGFGITQRLEDGQYFVCSAAFDLGASQESFLLGQDALRAENIKCGLKVENGSVSQPVKLQMRRSLVTDPPILMAFPPLVADYLQASGAA
ncbi:MAG: AraC family transcriptional regulator [Acidobacteriota bacterium]